MILIRAHHSIDVVEPRRTIQRHSTFPKFRNLQRHVTSFRLHEIDVVCQRKVLTQCKTNIGGYVKLILSDVFVAWLNNFDPSCGAFPWKPSIVQQFNQQNK